MMYFTWCFILYLVQAIQGQNYRDDRNEIPGTNCHSRLGVSQPGRTDPVYWLYASDGWASKARLHNEEAWISELPIYVDDRQPYYAWIQVFCSFQSFRKIIPIITNRVVKFVAPIICKQS